MIEFGYNSALVLVSTSLFGACAGLVGTLAVLRRRALVSDALAHSTLPGICLAFLLLYHFGAEEKSLVPLLIGGVSTGVTAVLLISFLLARTRLKEDAVIGIVLSFFYGIGVVLLSLIQSEATSGAAGLHHFIYGQAAALRASDGILIAASSLLCALIVLICLKEFRLLCFDQEFAETQLGHHSQLDWLLLSLIVLVVMIGLPAVGLVLVVALLIIPTVSARLLSDKFSTIALLSALIGALSCALGTAVSAVRPNTPAGATIVLIAGAFFMLALCFAPRRGLIAQGASLLSLQLDAKIDHILRRAFELAEKSNPEKATDTIVPAGEYLKRSPRYLTFLLQLRRLARRAAEGLVLTPGGRERATVVTRNHRLWEQYLVTYGITPHTHADYSADFVEHSLSAEIVQQLESELQAAGKSLPPLPHSVHPL